MLFHFNPKIILVTFDKSDLKIFLEENLQGKPNLDERNRSNLFFTEVLFIQSEIQRFRVRPVLTKGYTYITHTPVNTQKFPAPQKVFSGHFPDIPQPLLRNEYCNIYYHRLGLSVLEISLKWNHIVSVLLFLSSFAQHNIFEIQSC